MTQAIVQFGTSRFLLAHADLFIADALAGRAGAAEALGGITLVQTTNNPVSAARVTALAAGQGYPVVIRGLKNGQRIEETVPCAAVCEALQATNPTDWQSLRAGAADGVVRVILSNTADQGYLCDSRDTPSSLAADAPAPFSYPAKLLVLLHGRWQRSPQTPISLLPCELIERNGEVLHSVVSRLARDWHLPAVFVQWLAAHCVWANSLVDRIVSEAIEPVGAVAEPYALWAIQAQPGLILPCRHPAIVVTDDLAHYAKRKLFLLNAAHTYLADCWLREGRSADETVRQAMEDAGLRARLEAVWAEEILPVFGASGTAARQEAGQYVEAVRERFLNPFLRHRLADIAQNHTDKIQRRVAPVLVAAQAQGLSISQPRLRSVLSSS